MCVFKKESSSQQGKQNETKKNCLSGVINLHIDNFGILIASRAKI